MNITKRSSSGITLIEMVITIIISSILFITMGSLMMFTQQSWMKATNKATITDDVRYFKARAEYILRSSTGTLSAPGGTSLSFYSVSGVNETISRSGNNVLYKSGGTLKEVMLSSATALSFSVTGSNAINIAVIQTRENVVNISSFTVRCRNVN